MEGLTLQKERKTHNLQKSNAGFFTGYFALGRVCMFHYLLTDYQLFNYSTICLLFTLEKVIRPVNNRNIIFVVFIITSEKNFYLIVDGILWGKLFSFRHPSNHCHIDFMYLI